MSNLIEDFKKGRIVISIHSQEDMDEANALLCNYGISDFTGFLYCEGDCYGLYFDGILQTYYNMFPIDSTIYDIEYFKREVNHKSEEKTNPIMERQYYEMVDIMIKIAKEK